MEGRIFMRHVISRFLRHLEAEKNASATTIETYQYDLHKFDAYLVKRLGKRFLPGDVTQDHIRDYLRWLSEVGHQRATAPRLVHEPLPPYGHFSSMPTERAYRGIIQLQILLSLGSEWVKSVRCPGMSVVVFCESWGQIQALLEESGTGQ